MFWLYRFRSEVRVAITKCYKSVCHFSLVTLTTIILFFFTLNVCLKTTKVFDFVFLPLPKIMPDSMDGVANFFLKPACPGVFCQIFCYKIRPTFVCKIF